MNSTPQATTFVVVSKMIRLGYSFSFALGFADASVTDRDEPWLFDERVDNLRSMGVDLEEFVKGFEQYKTMEGIKNV